MRLLCTVLLAFTISSTEGCTVADDSADESPQSSRILVFSQSIGRGVPEEARKTFAEIRLMLVEKGMKPEVATWGLEGEQRMCVIVSAEQRDELMREIEKMAEGVTLLKVEEDEAGSELCGE